MWWIIFPIAAGLLLLYILFDQRKKIFKKRVKKTAAKPAIKSEVKKEVVEKKLNKKISFEKVEAVKSEAVVENVDLSPNSPQMYDVPFNTPRFSGARRPNVMADDDDFEEFRRKHSYSKFLGNKSILDQIKDLSPELKAIIFGNVLDRKDED